MYLDHIRELKEEFERKILDNIRNPRPNHGGLITSEKMMLWFRVHYDLDSLILSNSLLGRVTYSSGYSWQSFVFLQHLIIATESMRLKAILNRGANVKAMEAIRNHMEQPFEPLTKANRHYPQCSRLSGLTASSFIVFF